MASASPSSTAADDPVIEALYSRLREVDAKRKFFRRIDTNGHAATFAEGDQTLVVTFEQVSKITAGGEGSLPFASELREAFGWSYLCILAEQDSWFRCEEVYEFFDDLIEKGFFDAFDQVLFYGAGMCGHAACSFSVSAPGATVIAISPQATLMPERSAFDTRFPKARRLDFSTRYGYAPDMLDGAEAAHIFFDPEVAEDAAHAAQFNRSHMHLHRLRHFGDEPTAVLTLTETLPKIFALYDEERLATVDIARVLRDRRVSRHYLVRVLQQLVSAERTYLAAILCNNVVERMGAPRFRARRDALTAELNARGITLPFQVEA